MKLTSLSLMAGGLFLAMVPAVAAEPMTMAQTIAIPPAGIGTTPSVQTNPGLPPATPEESTGQPLGALPEQSTTTLGGITQFAPSGTSPVSPMAPGQPAPTSSGE